MHVNMKALSKKTSRAMNERRSIDALLHEVSQLTSRVTQLEEHVAALTMKPKPLPPLMNMAQRQWLQIHFPKSRTDDDNHLTAEAAAEQIQEEMDYQLRNKEPVYHRQRKWLESVGFEAPETAIFASKRIRNILENKYGQKILRGS